MDFIALDVETANADMGSVCALGLVHFKNGQVYKNLSTLIDPEDEFDGINISIHGINPEDVVGKPTMRTVFPALQANLQNCVVVHHTHFDKVAMRRVAQKYEFSELGCNWLDSARIARRAWSACARGGYGLAPLAQDFGITFQHHQAEEDARCAGLIVLRAIADTGIPLEGWFDRVERPLASADKLARAGNPEGPLYGEVIAFTGKLSIDRLEAAKMAADAGCDVGSGVTKHTTMLVVGEQDIRVLKGQDRSSKHRKAETLIAAGASIRIVSEQNFQMMVGP